MHIETLNAYWCTKFGKFIKYSLDSGKSLLSIFLISSYIPECPKGMKKEGSLSWNEKFRGYTLKLHMFKEGGSNGVTCRVQKSSNLPLEANSVGKSSLFDHSIKSKRPDLSNAPLIAFNLQTSANITKFLLDFLQKLLNLPQIHDINKQIFHRFKAVEPWLLLNSGHICRCIEQLGGNFEGFAMIQMLNFF